MGHDGQRRPGGRSTRSLPVNQGGGGAAPGKQTRSASRYAGVEPGAEQSSEPPASAGGGAVLPHDVSDGVARVTGADVSGARVHADAEANQAADAMDARAFTYGSDIYLGAGESTGDHSLMAHEAAHVAQQQGATASPQAKRAGAIPESHPSEREADAVADAVASGTDSRVELTPLAAPAVARRKLNTVTTPEELPTDVPPESIAPPSDEPHYDAEGNEIVQTRGGRWLLKESPTSLSFAIKAPYKHELLPINPNAAFSALRARCVAIKAEQKDYADSLGSDHKKWFALVYHYVTTHEIEAIDAGAYQYPHMKMQEVIAFHQAYKTNLDNWTAGNQAEVEDHWRIAFSTAEYHNGGDWLAPRATEIFLALLPAMQAHIRFDLPRAIAAVFTTHYAGIPGTSLSDFRADFDAMGPVFDQAQASILPDIKREAFWFDPGSWGWLQEGVSPFLFHVGIERDITWEKTGLLAGGMASGQSNSVMEARMRGRIGTAHPNSGSGAFEIRGDNISGFDWQGQPGGVPADPSAPGPVQEPAPEPPAFPEQLFFKLAKPKFNEERLERAIRDDQDLAPYRDLALWTAEVSGAKIELEGHASSEGSELSNLDLSARRAWLVEYFMFRIGADVWHNSFEQKSVGEDGAASDPEWRYVRVRVVDRGHGKQQHNAVNPNLPGEVNGQTEG